MIPRRRIPMLPEGRRAIRQSLRGPIGDRAVVEWECAVAEYVGAAEAAAVSSGRRGMMLILQHLGIGPGDEVVMPAYTLKDLASLIQETGATVRLADIDLETFNVTAATVEKAITLQTKAIVALHAFGAPCPIEAIVDVGAAHDVPVIEDCAHALGASVRRKRVGTFGYAAFFSFELTKPINTFGGGMIVSGDAELIRRVRQENGQAKDDWGPFRGKVRAAVLERILFATGLAYPMLYGLASPRWCDRARRLYRGALHAPPSDIRYSAAQAELGLQQLPLLEERIRRRNERAKLFRSLLAPEIQTQRVDAGCESTWYFFIASLPCDAAPVRLRLLLRGIDAAIEHEIADNCAVLLGTGNCSGVRHVFPRALVLPLYEDLSERAVRRIARTVNRLIP